MIFFSLGQRAAPGSSCFKEGRERCRKTIQGTLSRWDEAEEEEEEDRRRTGGGQEEDRRRTEGVEDRWEE
jgi:hypothetical protein